MADLLTFSATGSQRWLRPRPVRISHVALAITLDPTVTEVSGVVSHHCAWIGPAEPSIAFDRRGVEILAVEIDGQAVAWSCGAEDVRIAVPGSPAAFICTLRFRTVAPRKGLYFVAPDASHGRVAMAWTQGAMEDHSWWFPCFDSPNNLSTFAVEIRHPARFAALSGGVLERRVELGDGWATAVYRQDRPHVLYLLTVVVGDLVGVEDPDCPVPVTHWLPRGREQCAPAVFRATGFAIRELERAIGVPFPWQRYGHAVVHRFMWGGMENTTLTTISDRVLGTAAELAREDVDCDSLVIHELVHQWFGDLLTMRGWSDIWLNESFATYLEARITACWRAVTRGEREEDALARELWHNRAAYLEQHGSRYQRALVTTTWDDAYDLFDRVAYEQGSLVLHTLCAWLGEERFRAVLTRYVSDHRHGLVETADLRRAIEDATGEPADWFLQQWVYTPGHARVAVTWSHDPARGQLLVTLAQKEAPRRLQLVIAAAGLPEVRCELQGASHTIVFPAATAPAWVAVDPRGEVLVELEVDRAQPALIADAAAPAHARAAACATAAKLHADPALVAAVVAAAQHGPELVREEAIAALGTWRQAEPLLALFVSEPAPRLQRLVATALGTFRSHPLAARIADQLVLWADAAASGCTAGELLAARGALEISGATPLLRARRTRPSWNQRLAVGAVRGLGACGEPAALDEVLVLLADAQTSDVVLAAALAAAGALGARLPLARERVRRALEAHLAGPTLAVRVAAAKALGVLGDPAARAALQTQRAREDFGNVRRVHREVLHQLDQVAATTTATAELTRRLDELERIRARLEVRLDALEKRMT